MARKAFGIAPEDPDLINFEMFIASSHPEFIQLKTSERPSYEHLDFHTKTLGFSYFPGCNEAYCPLALSKFEKGDVQSYEEEFLDKIKTPLYQHLHQNYFFNTTALSIIEVMDRLEIRLPTSSAPMTVNDYLEGLVDKLFQVWDEWIIEEIRAKLSKRKASLSIEILEGMITQVSAVVEELMEFANKPYLNRKELVDFPQNQKFALLSTSLYLLYKQGLEEYIEQVLNEWRLFEYETSGRDVSIVIDTKRYIDLILMHELSMKSLDIEKKQKGRSKAKLSSPATFMYTRMHGGYKASDIRATYRWLFIKAWLYSWLKVNAVSANKAAEEIAKNDCFFYLDKVSRKVGKDGVVESDDECYARRQKQLNSEFSKWKKYDGPFAYISDSLFSKSRNAYEKSQQSK